MNNISYFLWFDGKAEEAMNFYTSVFSNAKRGRVNPMTASFELYGQSFIALNGGPQFKFTPAISFFISCNTEQEVDSLWQKLMEGGSALMPLNKYPFSEKYGWVQDKYGLSWQLNLASTGQKLMPCLLFVGHQCGKAEEAAKFYTGIFKNSGIERMERYQPGEQGPEGTIKHGVFTLEGQHFVAMDSNLQHNFTFTEAISLFVHCQTQEQVDYFWENLSADGQKSRCGWLKDKYGVSWQVVPDALGQLMGDPNPAKSKRVLNAMMKMDKIIIADLQKAHDGQ